MTHVGTPGGATGAATDPSTRWLFRTGGIAALLLVAGYLATFPLYAAVGGPPPNGAEARLAHYAPHLAGWWGILYLMVFTDLLYLVAWLALHEALRGADRNWSLLSLVCAGLFVGLDLAVTWPNHAAMFDLSKGYAAAAGDAERARIIAAAGFGSAAMDSQMLGIYGMFIPSMGPLFAGLAMWKGGFDKIAAVIAFLIGLTGLVGAAGPYFSRAFEVMQVPNALLVMVWFGFVGVRLVRLGRR